MPGKKDVRVGEADSGFVTVEKGATINTGDYNSTKVSVSVTLPINPTAQQVDDAKRTVRIADRIVDAEMERQVKAIDDNLK